MTGREPAPAGGASEGLVAPRGGGGPASGAAPGGRAASAPLLGHEEEPTLFELSVPGRRAWSLRTTGMPALGVEELVPDGHRRPEPVALPEVAERDLVAHFTRLAHRQYAVDLGAYPLGSCTMKYNPKLADWVASLPGLAAVHPGAPARLVQGWMELLVELEAALCTLTGMAAATLQPPAGAAGELTGLLLMRACHLEREGRPRRKVLIPDSAHGTNPASVTLGGYEAVTVPSDARGLVDLGALRRALDEDVAGMMLTNPNTFGLFEEDILEVSAAVHGVGGLLYYDGANLNAILGVARPSDMGFDIVHLNLHKTFATPHGGGGPGAGPVAVTEALAPFLPGPRPVRRDGAVVWEMPERSIGRVHSWHGNALVLARAYAYLRLLGGDGLRQVAEAAVLNANWLRKRLAESYDVPYDRPVMHECVVSARSLAHETGVRALDVAKGLLERGFHAPTIYFPLVVEEALMVEPTETESPETLAALAAAFEDVAHEAREIASREGPEASRAAAHAAPRHTPVGRLDEARAARSLVLTFDDRR